MSVARARPDQLVLVVGTATEVGKTWVTARLAERLLAGGRTVACRKPVQSFDPAYAVTDAEVLAAASGVEAEEVCPRHRWYPLPMAPPMAAEALGLPPFRAHELVSEIAFPEHVDVGLVETVGGVRSPLAIDGDSTDLSVALSPTRVLLVADAGLGTVNAVRLSVAALASRDPVVFLNRFDEADDLHRRNRRWLLEQDRLPVETEVGALPGALGLV